MKATSNGLALTSGAFFKKNLLARNSTSLIIFCFVYGEYRKLCRIVILISPLSSDASWQISNREVNLDLEVKLSIIRDRTRLLRSPI